MVSTYLFCGCSYKVWMAQKSFIDFCIVLSDLFSDVLDVRVERGAELSTDHHLVQWRKS